MRQKETLPTMIPEIIEIAFQIKAYAMLSVSHVKHTLIFVGKEIGLSD
jgi:hypothetical protein